MAKLRKNIQVQGKEKNKVVTGKIIKTKNTEHEQPQVKKLCINQTPAGKLDHQRLLPGNTCSATPSSNKSMLGFTSTPMYVNQTSNGKLSLNKFPPRSPLSPIFNNIGNKKQSIEISNLPGNGSNDLKAANGSVDPKIKIDTRKKLFEMLKIAPVSSGTDKPKVSEILYRNLGGGKASIKNKKYVISDSGSSERENCTEIKTAKKASSKSENDNTLIRRLQSDWSSASLDEIQTQKQIPKPDGTPKISEMHESKQYRENKCSKLRVRLRKHSICPTFNVKNSKISKATDDTSVAKPLNSDFKSEILKKIQTPNLTNYVQRTKVTKRLLTPLIEMSIEKEYATPEIPNREDDDYSSSAEFQSDDENNHSFLKKAPTWQDLSKKTNETSLVRMKPVPDMKIKRCTIKLRQRKCDSKKARNLYLSQKVDNEVSHERDKINKSCEDYQMEGFVKNKKTSLEEKSNENKGQTENKKIPEDNILNANPYNVPLNENHIVGVKDVDVLQLTAVSSSTQQNDVQIQNSTLHSGLAEADKTDIVDLTNSKYPPKFFHSRVENNVSVTKPVETRKRLRSSKKKKQESIYEFLSQSSSDTNNPVDDVIQKMIKTGKVVVAKHKKGSGKSVLPRKHQPKKSAKNKVAETEKEPRMHLRKLKHIKEKAINHEGDSHLKDGGNEVTKNEYKRDLRGPNVVATRKPLQEKAIDDDDNLHFEDGGNEIPEEHVRDPRGFSNLARCAMIKQAGRIQKTPHRKSITDKKKLLEMAKKFVNQSTPVRMTPQPMNAPQFSPMPGNKSPWRVDDDRMPNLFYLGRNSDNLPSFSSDYIPMTPTKYKSKSISSFSSNDSNGENVAPPNAKTDEANIRFLPNSRKALTYRSPLKQIEVLDVAILPPLALHSYAKKSNEDMPKNKSTKSPDKQATNLFDSIQNNVAGKSSLNISNKNQSNLIAKKDNFNKSKSDNPEALENNSLESIQSHNSDKSGSDVSNNNASNLFGFEELIDDENDQTNVSIDKTILPNKDLLKKRLERLKDLRPNKPVIISNKTIPMKPVFDDVRPKQKTIKQMLCSTMINHQDHNNACSNDMSHHNTNENAHLSNLFKDLEPETTFNDSNPRRTYNRQFKKKRKLRHNFVMFMDSDVSEDEDEENFEETVKHYKVKPKKRQKKKDPQLDEFVNEFNEMCKEVSQYELIVE